MVHAVIASSISRLVRTRSLLRAKRTSSAMSGRPAARISRLKMLSPLPPMMMYLPSLHGYVFVGTMPVSFDPWRSRTMPNLSNSGTIDSIRLKMPS